MALAAVALQHAIRHATFPDMTASPSGGAVAPRDVDSNAVSPAADDGDAYLRLLYEHNWQVPDRFNIGRACGGERPDRPANAPAVIEHDAGGQHRRYSRAALRAAESRAVGALQALGVGQGDRVAIVLPQRFETAVAHLAAHHLGAVAMPLSQLFGPEALAFRLQDSAAVVAVCDAATVANLRAVRAECPALRHLLLVDVEPAGEGEVSWQAACAAVDEANLPPPVATAADDPAVLIYTSGTTGPPKGALIPHRALLGNLTGFVCSQNWLLPQSDGTASLSIAPDIAPADAVFWSPADWAWTGGLMDALLPALYFGVPIVAYSGRFDPAGALALMAAHRVTNSFIFPTALKAMMKAVPRPRAAHDLHLRAIMSAGEAVGDTVFDWCRDELGVLVNEMFGQTEINYAVGNCTQRDAQGRTLGWPPRPGSMGRGYPGHRLAVIDDAGEVCPPGTPGEVAVHRRDVHGVCDPVFFLGYWRREDATRSKYVGDPDNSWCRTGDAAVMDADGYLWYQGRSDDVFKVAGYRIGPSEIENCLVRHPAVANAAVVPKPDADRGALVKAYVVLAPGFAGDEALIAALQQHVRARLAPYEYPKEIEFIGELPMTTTGKVQRRVLRLQEEERARQRSSPPG